MRVVEMTQRKYWCGAIHLARPRAYFKRRVAGQKHFVRGEGLRLRLIGLCAPLYRITERCEIPAFLWASSRQCRSLDASGSACDKMRDL